MSRTATLADALFPATRQKMLGILFGQPGKSFYASELIRLAQSGRGAVQRELASFAESGLITARPIGNQIHYQANADSPVFAELASIIQKTTGLADPIRTVLTPLAHQIIAAFVYGSVAKKTDTARSDVDLMLISDDLNYGDLFSALQNASNTLGREVNPTILTRMELAKRKAHQESFLTRVLSQPKIWIVGGEADLADGKPVRPGQAAEI
jgi:predicted nucleotidyltransferase